MNRKSLIIGFSLTAIVLVGIGVFISINSTRTTNSETATHVNGFFNAKSPEEKAVFIARLNDGEFGFESDTIDNVSLTSGGKYWIVDMGWAGDYGGVVTVDAKTWMSKKGDGKWKSLDELKASYIADIQTVGDEVVRESSEVNADGKEIWKVSLDKFNYEHNEWEQSGYVYVDVETGKSKKVDLAGSTKGWKTLKEVDDMGGYRDALRDLYSK